MNIKSKGILFVGLILVLNISMLSTQALSTSYIITPNQSYIYEVKYSLYPWDYDDTSKRDQLNTTMVRIDIGRFDVGTISGTADPNENSGIIFYNIYSLVVGKSWTTHYTNQMWSVNSSNPNTHGNVGFVDGSITIIDVVNEFRSAPIVKPNVTIQASAANLYSLKNRFEGNIYTAYDSLSTPTAIPVNDTISISSFTAFDNTGGKTYDYSFSLSYVNNSLETYLIKSVDRPEHIVFSAVRLYQDITFPEEENEVNGFGIGYMAVSTLLGIGLILKKKK